MPIAREMPEHRPQFGRIDRLARAPSMSIKLMAAAEVPASRKMVLLVIADIVNDEGAGCFFSMATIARKAGMSWRAAQRGGCDPQRDRERTKGQCALRGVSILRFRKATRAQFEFHPRLSPCGWYDARRTSQRRSVKAPRQSAAPEAIRDEPISIPLVHEYMRSSTKREPRYPVFSNAALIRSVTSSPMKAMSALTPKSERLIVVVALKPIV